MDPAIETCDSCGTEIVRDPVQIRESYDVFLNFEDGDNTKVYEWCLCRGCRSDIIELVESESPERHPPDVQYLERNLEYLQDDLDTVKDVLEEIAENGFYEDSEEIESFDETLNDMFNDVRIP